MLGNKKGGVSTGMTILVLIALAILVTSIVFVARTTGPAAATIAPQDALTETGIQSVGAIVSCPDDSTTSGQVRYQESLASVITYGDPTVYFIPQSEGQERVTSGALATDGSYSAAVDLPCLTSGTKWRAVAITSQDAYSSAEEAEGFVASGAFVKRDLVGKAIDSPKFKVEDKYSGGSTFFNNSGNAGTTAAGTGYVAFDGTQDTIADQAGATALTIGTDGYLDSRIYIKTNNTKNQFGEDGLKVWMLVDADGSEWDEPIVARDGGQKLVDVMQSMMPDDLRKYSGFEYAYEIGSIGDRESFIDLYMESAAGVNPSTDPIVEFCAEGKYNSVKEKDTVKVGCWTDAANQAAVATANLPKFKYDIS